MAIPANSPPLGLGAEVAVDDDWEGVADNEPCDVEEDDDVLGVIETVVDMAPTPVVRAGEGIGMLRFWIRMSCAGCGALTMMLEGCMQFRESAVLAQQSQCSLVVS